jgi:tetratricopeptide (TPR) repeat protein
VSQYERALQALEWKATESPEEGALLRCELLVALGRAELRAGETAKARQTFQRAAELARRWQAPEWLARTALGLGAGFAWFWGYGAGTVDDVLVSLLQEALDAVGPQDSAVRVHLLSRLAVGLYWSSRAEQRARIAPLSEEAVAMAGRLGEPSLRLQALASGCWANWRPDNLEQRLTAATEIVHLARQVCDREMTLLGHEYRIVYLLEAGETAAADRQIEEFGVLAQELGQACYQWYTPMFRATRAMMAGDFEEAERLIHRALEVGQRAASETVMQACAGHLFALRREQGRAGELEPAFRGFVRQYPQMTAWRCGLAALYMDMGEQESARMQLAHLASNDFADLRRDNMWLAAAAVLAEVCSALGDARQTGLLYDMLLPYAGANVVAGVGFFSAGSVSRYLGLLASALCRRREAGRHFEEALALDRRMAAKPFVAHTLSDYAAMLLATGGDREHALRLLGEADEIARSLHMNQLAPSIRARLEVAGEVRLRSVGTRAQSAGAARRPGVAATVLTLTPSRGGPRAAPGVVPPGGRAHAGNPPAEDEPPAAGNSFQRRGEYWSISYEGHSFLLKNAKGLYYLAELLRRPALEVHALELMAAIAAPRARTVAETPPQAMRGGGLSIEAGDAGEILDRQASAAYRRRLRELRDEIEEARRFNDLGRLEKAQREADFVARELAQAIGIGGRHRRAGAAAERARMSVTRSIRLVLRKIGEHDPALGSHLASTVKTGTFCSYRPDTRVPISWRL